MTETTERFGAKPGAGFGDEEAQKIGRELADVARGKPSNGITAAELVAAAAGGEAPTCAARLTWDDAQAAHLHRLAEARTIINHVLISEDDEEQGVRAYHAVTVEVQNGGTRRERRYVPLEVIRKEKPLADQVIAQARDELLRAVAKLNMYRERVAADYPDLARVVTLVSEHLDETRED